MVFHLRALLAAAVVLVAASTSFTPAQAAKGQFSIGGNFGTGIYSNGEFNDSLEAIGFDKVTSGWEYGGSIRYGMSPKVALDYEINFINGSSTTSVGGFDVEVETSTIAGPLSIYYLLSENDNSLFNLFVGAGPMFSTKYEVSASGLDEESASKTTFYAHAGLEAQYKVSPTFALTARALGRLAKASDVEDKDDPSSTIDVDLSGAAFAIGARVYFGGSGGN